MSCNINYKIIHTGSQGNAVVINNKILIDCGVSFKALLPYYKDFKLVLLTHIHSDHFNKATIRTLARERPALRFGCGKWLVELLIECGVKPSNIDVYVDGAMYCYGLDVIIPVLLVHNVLNFGYKIHFKDGSRMIYCTDTNNLNGVSAKNYDLYMIEANYEDEEIKERISQKKEAGEYAYEVQAMKNHLSKAKCDEFIYDNIGANGTYVYLHAHVDRGTQNES